MPGWSISPISIGITCFIYTRCVADRCVQMPALHAAYLYQPAFRMLFARNLSSGTCVPSGGVSGTYSFPIVERGYASRRTNPIIRSSSADRVDRVLEPIPRKGRSVTSTPGPIRYRAVARRYCIKATDCVRFGTVIARPRGFLSEPNSECRS